MYVDTKYNNRSLDGSLVFTVKLKAESLRKADMLFLLLHIPQRNKKTL
jgi:hypothetical protein